MPKNSKAKIEATERYQKAKTKLYGIRFLLDKDQDIIDKLDSINNKVDYLRNLIKQDIYNSK